MIKPLRADVRPSLTYGEIYGDIFGLGGTQHTGTDYPAPIGTPIVAPISGTVTQVKNQITGYGKHIYITQNNISVLLAHMEEIAVSQGQIVEQGEIVGYVGETGWATGPHVHIGVKDTNITPGQIGQWDNPVLYYGVEPVPPAPAPAQTKIYTILKGDTLWAISKKFYGNGNQWPLIYENNKDTINNPNRIYPGQTIRIP